MQPDFFFQAEHQVHVVDSLAACALQQVIYYGDDEQFAFDLLEVDEAFVRVHDLLQVRVLARNEGERVVAIILLVEAHDFFQLNLAVQIRRGEDAAREAAAHRDEVDAAPEAVLQLPEALSYLRQMLVRERLVDRDVVVAPAIMRRGGRLHARTRRAGNRVHVQVGVQHQMLGQREETQLDTRGEATGVGDMLRLANPTAVQLRKAIDEVVRPVLDAVVHAQVDNLDGGRHLVALHELLRVAVRGTEEEAVYLVEREFAGEAEVRFAEQTLVHVGNLVARVARAVHERDFHIRMVDEQAYQLTRRIACPTDDSYLNHKPSSSLWLA